MSRLTNDVLKKRIAEMQQPFSDALFLMQQGTVSQFIFGQYGKSSYLLLPQRKRPAHLPLAAQ